MSHSNRLFSFRPTDPKFYLESKIYLNELDGLDNKTRADTISRNLYPCTCCRRLCIDLRFGEDPSSPCILHLDTTMLNGYAMSGYGSSFDGIKWQVIRLPEQWRQGKEICDACVRWFWDQGYIKQASIQFLELLVRRPS